MLFEKILSLFSSNGYEIFSLVFGIISVYYTIKQDILCWVFGIISCFLLGVYFLQSGFYANFILQIAYIIQSFIGIINWKKTDNKIVKHFGILKTLSFIPLSIVLGLIFTHLTIPNNNILYLDGISGFIALYATYLLITKKLEAWWVFILSNILIIILTLHQGLYYLALYYMILIIMDISGYKEWKKELV